MNSIQRRLSIGLGAVLLVIGVVLAQTGLWVFDQGLRRYLSNGLQEEAESLLVAIQRGPAGLQLDPQRVDAIYERLYSGRYFLIRFDDTTWRSRSLWDHDLPMPAHKGLVAELADGPEGQHLLLFRGDYRRIGLNLQIAVAQDYGPVLQRLERLRWIGLGVGGLALLLILFLQRLAVRRALRPLEQVRQQIAQLQEGQRSQLDSQVPLELTPLVDQVNHLLQYTEESLRRSRNALGNLGHALKTPLAVLISLADREEVRAQPELRRLLQEHLEQIDQRLARELGRARLVGEALPGAHFDCAEELPSLCDMLRLIHGEHLDIDWQAQPGLRLPFDREDLLELLGNLLDNACKWADGRVRLSIEKRADGYLLQVDDDGPGIPEGQRDSVLERGTRLDEQVAGHGLGLGIARDIAEACGGRLRLESSDLGGLRVCIELPLKVARA
ncbi:sensor histidine kinase [Pseudomonas schmalbachii]|uniref:histidine kinase n=1 Tax=Pseudomonas schmalbachii TaxID=2816993 RepID=A0ABS3TKN9_9PSED|nr:sensor histidine kinase [Pseudomonas schmalbachii]MBO3274220.1 sensor histidine kinase [Pseudomonas schmalbachii]